MKKIAILLLSFFSSSLVVANNEINACKAGVKARGRSNTNIDLLVTGEETVDGVKPCASFDKVVDRAACIFGYNTIIPMMFDSNVIPGNGCLTNGIIDQKACPDWWNYDPADGAGKGCGGDCCVCEYPGTTNTSTTNSTTNSPDGYGVCQYGKAIGWNLSKSGPKYSLGNYYYNLEMLDGTPIIKKLWGVSDDPNSKNEYVNWLNFIKIYINHISPDGKFSLYGRNNLFSNFTNLNKTISGAEAAKLVL